MKQLFLVLLITSTIIGYSQSLPVDPQTQKVSYKEIVEIPGESENELFNKAKKWMATKDSETNPYTITYENQEAGNFSGKGSFTLPGGDKKYVVAFLINVATKDGKYKYEFTDFTLLYTTKGGVTSGGFSYWSSSSYQESETLEYSLETFYPIRLERKRKPSIKWYEEINANSFAAIDREMEALISSLEQTIAATDDW